jgi:outer membrane protein TolC
MSFFSIHKCCITLIIFYLCAERIQAQYSLSVLADSAEHYLPVIKQREAGINASKAGLTATRHSFLPQIRASEQVNIGTDNSLAGSYFTFGITPSTSSGVSAENKSTAESGNLGIIYSEYELYNFGLNTAKVNNAKAGIDLQEANLQREQYVLQLQVARLYFSILKNQYKLHADKQNVYRYDNIYSVIRALASAGIRPGADSSLARAELSKAKVNYNQTMGILLQLKDEMGYLTGLPASLIIIDTASPDPDKHIIQSDSLTSNASTFPLIRSFLSRRNTYLTNEQVIRKSYLPKIILAASTWARGSSIQYNDNYKSLPYGWGYQRFNYVAGIAVTYNLFNGLYKKDQLAINRFQFEASDADLQQQLLALQADSRKADHAIQTASANFLEIPVQLQSANDTYRQKVAQYKAGLISLIDLTNASFVLYRSQIDYSEGLTDLFQARLDKAASTGSLYNFIQSFK